MSGAARSSIRRMCASSSGFARLLTRCGPLQPSTPVSEPRFTAHDVAGRYQFEPPLTKRGSKVSSTRASKKAPEQQLPGERRTGEEMVCDGRIFGGRERQGPVRTSSPRRGTPQDD